MTDLSSVEIPKPLNWQDFQRCCVPLFRNIIGDPQLQEWGREGQDQQGIDLFGFRDKNPKQPAGIQCKRINEPITEETIRHGRAPLLLTKSEIDRGVDENNYSELLERTSA